MANFLKRLRQVFKNKNKPTAFSTTPSFKSYIDFPEDDFNVSFTSPLQDQNPIYNVPKSENFDNNSLQEPIYSTIKKTKDMGSQTELDFPSSNSSSLCSSASASNPLISSALARTTPPPPPAPDFFNTADPLALCKERQKNNGNVKKSPLEQKPKNAQEEMMSELKKTLERRRKASSAED